MKGVTGQKIVVEVGIVENLVQNVFSFNFFEYFFLNYNLMELCVNFVDVHDKLEDKAINYYFYFEYGVKFFIIHTACIDLFLICY